MVVEISCEEVWREISDYLEGVVFEKCGKGGKSSIAFRCIQESIRIRSSTVQR
jgi:hypothetical protein